MRNSGKIAVILTVILLLTAAAYSNIFFNQKAIDDKIFIGAYHPSAAEAFAGAVPKGHEGVYRPVRGLLYLVYYQFFGANPFFYHLHSLTVHLISTILVYLIMRELWFVVIPREPPVGGSSGNPDASCQIAASQTNLPRLAERDPAPPSTGLYLAPQDNDNFAFIGALLFGLHPIHTESITYIAASMEMTGVMFMLGSFYLFQISCPTSHGRPARPDFICSKSGGSPGGRANFKFQITHILSLLLALLAFFTYEMTLTLPLLILWYEWTLPVGIPQRDPSTSLGMTLRVRLPRRPPAGGLLAMTIAAAAGAYAFVRFFILDIGSRGPYLANSVYLTALTMPRVIMKYIFLMIWPVNLANNHVIAPGIEAFVYRGYRTAAIAGQSVFDPEILFAITVITVIIFITVISRKRFPLLSFGLGWFFISLLPGLEIIPQGSIMNEKLMYIPSIGIILAIVYLIFNFKFLIFKQFQISCPTSHGRSPGGRANFPAKQDPALQGKFQIILISLLAVFYGARTFARNADWKNDLALWQKDVEVYPNDSAYARFALGNAYNDRKDYQNAVIQYQKSVEINPGFAVGYASLARTYNDLGNAGMSNIYYQKAAAAEPGFWGKP